MTHDVNPVPCHSHNDYWRRVPLYSALTAGCISIEADVWLDGDGDELRVGHTPQTVLRGHSLRSLYLNPLLEMLQSHNSLPDNITEPGESSLSCTGSECDRDVVGVFANDPKQSLVLLIDFKAEGERIWPHLVEQLQPLRENGFLSYFNGSDMIDRPIVVVVTGDAPIHRAVENSTYRDIFYDAPLDKLPRASDLSLETLSDETHSADEIETVYNAQNSYYASVNFRKAIGSLPLSRLSQDQLARLQSQIRAAHALGFKVRYWETPSWPVGLRNYVWRILVREGVDILNVDDLYGATRQDWRSRSWWR